MFDLWREGKSFKRFVLFVIRDAWIVDMYSTQKKGSRMFLEASFASLGARVALWRMMRSRCVMCANRDSDSAIDRSHIVKLLTNLQWRSRVDDNDNSLFSFFASQMMKAKQQGLVADLAPNIRIMKIFGHFLFNYYDDNSSKYLHKIYCCVSKISCDLTL